jgi:hypothetical protein
MEHLYLIPLSAIIIVVALSMLHWCTELVKWLRVTWRVLVCVDVVLAVALGLMGSLLVIK